MMAFSVSQNSVTWQGEEDSGAIDRQFETIQSGGGGGRRRELTFFPVHGTGRDMLY